MAQLGNPGNKDAAFRKFKGETQSDSTEAHVVIQDRAFWGGGSNTPVPWLASCELSCCRVAHCWRCFRRLFPALVSMQFRQNRSSHSIGRHSALKMCPFVPCVHLCPSPLACFLNKAAKQVILEKKASHPSSSHWAPSCQIHHSDSCRKNLLHPSFPHGAPSHQIHRSAPTRHMSIFACH